MGHCRGDTGFTHLMYVIAYFLNLTLKFFGTPVTKQDANTWSITQWDLNQKSSVREGLICKRLRRYESLNIEVICSKVTISNKTWVIFSIYKLPNYSIYWLSMKNLETI